MAHIWRLSRGFCDFCKKYNIKRLFFDLLWPDVIPEEDIFTNPDKTAIGYLRDVIPQISDRCREYGIFFHCTFERCLKDDTIANSEETQKRQDCLFLLSILGLCMPVVMTVTPLYSSV